MANYKQCIGVRDGKQCRNQAITDYCSFCDPERQAYRKGRVLPTITGGLGSSLSYRALKSAIDSLNRHIPKKKKKQVEFDEWEATDSEYFDYGFNSGSSDFRLSSSTYKSTHSGSSSTYKSVEKPYVALQKGERKEVDSIAHMRYIVERAQDGKYYAVYQSRNLKDNSINQEHKSKPHYSYFDAEGEFNKGESLWRIKERIKKASDPNWIPPNLRHLAVFGQWQYIEDKDRPALIEWVSKGMKDWHGPFPKKKNTK